MIIGVPKEIKDSEHRVALTPEGARLLIQQGHQVLIQASAGAGSGFLDTNYQEAGANIVYHAEKVWMAEMILKVKEPLPEEYEFLRPDLMLFTYLHLAANEQLTRELLEKKTLGIAYETVQLSNGFLPLLAPMSEVAGCLAVQVGAQYLREKKAGF